MAATTDVIDTSATATLNIYKYDLSAAQSQGVDVSQFTADGEVDEAAAAALGSYALKGVEYTYLKVGDIEVKSDDGDVGVLYTLRMTWLPRLKFPAQIRNTHLTLSTAQ